MTRLLFLLALCSACSTFGAAIRPEPSPEVAAPPPLQISMLPMEVDIEALLPPAPAEIKIESKSPQFDDVPIHGGMFCPDGKPAPPCFKLQAGFLVDEKTYAKGISDYATVKRLRVENRVFRDLRLKERPLLLNAEKAYQQEIVNLRKENVELRAPRRWESMRFYVGFLLGAALATVTAYGAAHAVK